MSTLTAHAALITPVHMLRSPKDVPACSLLMSLVVGWHVPGEGGRPRSLVNQDAKSELVTCTALPAPIILLFLIVTDSGCGPLSSAGSAVLVFLRTSRCGFVNACPDVAIHNSRPSSKCPPPMPEP